MKSWQADSSVKDEPLRVGFHKKMRFSACMSCVRFQPFSPAVTREMVRVARFCSQHLIILLHLASLQSHATLSLDQTSRRTLGSRTLCASPDLNPSLHISVYQASACGVAQAVRRIGVGMCKGTSQNIVRRLSGYRSQNMSDVWWMLFECSDMLLCHVMSMLGRAAKCFRFWVGTTVYLYIYIPLQHSPTMLQL